MNTTSTLLLFIAIALSTSSCENLTGNTFDSAEMYDTAQSSDTFEEPDADTLDLEDVLQPDSEDPNDPDSDKDLVDLGDEGFEDAESDAADTQEDVHQDVPSMPVLYRGYELRSPITPYVVEQMLAIYDMSDSPDDLVFMKVGASGTVSTNLLYCFSGGDHYVVDLDGRDDLWMTIEAFREGDADGTTPFDRETVAARVGRTASWVIGGNPSPLDSEITAINPRFAIVNYGTNDMGMGTTYYSALTPYYENMSELLDQITDQGIVPIITGMNPRTDNASAALWVPTYDTINRGMAQARQIPYINLYLAVKDLPDQGLVSDGLHGNVYRHSGRAQGCIFTTEALQFNYNVRNLHTIGVLDQVYRTVVLDMPAPDLATNVLTGEGSPDSPYIIDELPFTHYSDTRESPHTNLDAYPTCDTGQDESGPEYLYVLELEERTPIRAIVLVLDGVDVDLHLLEPPFTSDECLAGPDKMLELTLDPGTYIFALDTYVARSGTPFPGEFLFAILECESADADCL